MQKRSFIGGLICQQGTCCAVLGPKAGVFSRDRRHFEPIPNSTALSHATSTPPLGESRVTPQLCGRWSSLAAARPPLQQLRLAVRASWRAARQLQAQAAGAHLHRGANKQPPCPSKRSWPASLPSSATVLAAITSSLRAVLAVSSEHSDKFCRRSPPPLPLQPR